MVILHTTEESDKAGLSTSVLHHSFSFEGLHALTEAQLEWLQTKGNKECTMYPKLHFHATGSKYLCASSTSPSVPGICISLGSACCCPALDLHSSKALTIVPHCRVPEGLENQVLHNPKRLAIRDSVKSSELGNAKI
jgi:hypothetical protein